MYVIHTETNQENQFKFEGMSLTECFIAKVTDKSILLDSHYTIGTKSFKTIPKDKLDNIGVYSRTAYTLDRTKIPEHKAKLIENARRMFKDKKEQYQEKIDGIDSGLELILDNFL